MPFQDKFKVQNLNDQIGVKNLEVEGSFKLKLILPIRLNIKKCILQGILVFLSIGLWSIVLYWKIDLQVKLLYEISSIDKCTHFYLTFNKKMQMIVAKQIQKNNYFSNQIEESIIFQVLKIMYIYKRQKNRFYPVQFIQSDKVPLSEIKKKYSTAQLQQKSEQLQVKQSLYGKSQIQIEIPSFISYLVIELIRPFMFISYFGIIVWFIESFISTSFLLIASILFFIIVNYFIIRYSYQKIQKLFDIQKTINVYRLNEENITTKYEINSNEIIPGDIIEIQENQDIPSDCILLQGDAIVEEGILTGESIPVHKVPITDDQYLFSFKNTQRHIIYQGTKIKKLQFQKEQNIQFDGKILGLVIRTQFHTLKGQLIRSLLFQKENNDDFFFEVLNFMFFYGIFIWIAFSYSYIFMLLNYPSDLSLLRFLDIILWIFPPTLQTLFQLYQTQSLIRLKFQGIIGIQPQKLNNAGIVDVICFDKTGTITQQGIILDGILQFNNDKFQDNNNVQQDNLFYKNMATCHSVSLENNVKSGDTLEIQMQEFSNWNMIDDNQYEFKNQKIQTIKSFDFESSLQRMSVLVQDGNQKMVFTKGSPEKIKNLCINIPKDFDQVLEQYTIKGLRILALAYKIQNEDVKNRDQIEKDLIFQGFILFKNPLKQNSKLIINKLIQANLNCKIISGDNINTTIEVGKLVGIVNMPICICDFQDGQFNFKLNNNETLYLDYSQFKQDFNQLNMDQDILILENIVILLQKQGQIQLALTGVFFEQIYTIIKKQEINNIKKQELSSIKQIMEITQIFARMLPNQKSEIIKLIQKLELKVCMVGDGANDFTAIKDADVGISFTESEGSLSAPFSSNSQELDCVEKIVLEGRNLIMNNIELLRVGYFNSFTRIMICQILMHYGFYFNNDQWFIQFIGTISIPFVIGFSKPVKNIYKQKPIYNSFSASMIIGQLGYFSILAIGMFVNLYFLYYHDMIKDHGLVDGKYRTTGQIQTVYFYYFWTIGFGAYLPLRISSPFKQKIYQNYIISITYLLIFVYGVLINFFQNEVLYEAVNLTDINLDMKIITFITQIIILILLYFYEEIFVKEYLEKIDFKKHIKNFKTNGWNL